MKVRPLSSYEERWPQRWSYSAWSQLQKCAFAYYGRHVLGIKDARTSPAMDRGNKLHKIQEEYLKGNITVLPPEFHKLKNALRLLKQEKPVVEQFWGIGKDWKPSKWDSWCVIKMDAAVPPSKKNGYSLFFQDLKTGREYDDNYEQGTLYAAIGRAIHPSTRKAFVEFWYMDSDKPEPYVQFEFNIGALREEREKWHKRGLATIKRREEYKPTPTDDNCRWCNLRTDKGGPCSAWKQLK